MIPWGDVSEIVKKRERLLLLNLYGLNQKKYKRGKKNIVTLLRFKTNLNPKTKCGYILLEHCGCLGRGGCKNKLLFFYYKNKTRSKKKAYMRT